MFCLDIQLILFLILIFLLFPIVLVLNYNRVKKELEEEVDKFNNESE